MLNEITITKSEDWDRSESSKFEKIHTEVFSTSLAASRAIASEIAALINQKSAKKEYCVIGLATGSSPIEVYAELVRLYRDGSLSFKNVVSFNLDEYYPSSYKWRII